MSRHGRVAVERIKYSAIAAIQSLRYGATGTNDVWDTVQSGQNTVTVGEVTHHAKSLIEASEDYYSYTTTVARLG